jgi:O-antigen biosynthesis protein
LYIKIQRLGNQIAELTVQLSTAKDKIEEVKHQNEALSEIINEMQSARVWKLGQRYYHLRDNTILKYPYYFGKATRREGLKAALRKARNHQLLPNSQELPNEKDVSQEIFKSIISELNARPLKGVFVLTSAFEFDELYNQRVINLSKYLAREGWGVVYVAWVWHDASEAPPGEVKENIFQIPSNIFLNDYAELKHLSAQQKIFTVEFPYPGFLEVAFVLRSSDFVIHYDIIDEWEEFHQVGQAEWFDQEAEHGLVINANILSAVSEPLIQKFSNLRNDIHLIPNGFDPAILGDFQNIAQRNFKDNTINLGYFGHLTPSWFDWSFIKEVLALASVQNLDVNIHLIGYGEPDLQKILGDDQKSIVFHGKVHPKNLHSHVKDWDLAILPFVSSALSRAVDPIKIYEYLYFGLPVIVKGIPHLSDLSNVYVVSDATEFMDILVALRDQKITKEIPKDIFDYTWEERFDQLIQILIGESWMSL